MTSFREGKHAPVICGGQFGVGLGLGRQLVESPIPWDSISGRVHWKTDCTARKLPLGNRLGIPRLASQGRVKASPVKLFLKQQASGDPIAPFHTKAIPLVGFLAHFAVVIVHAPAAASHQQMTIGHVGHC
jgi:hypothetical protein